MRVLVLDGVGPFGGASRSLYEMLRAVPAGQVQFCFVGVRGTVEPFYRSISDEMIAVRGLTRFDNTRYSHYRGLRWLVVLRELLHFPITLVALFRARRRWPSVDIVHANEITEIIPLLLARWLFRAPAVIHVRSVQRTDSTSWRTKWINARLRTSVDAVIAIDQNVRDSLPSHIAVDVIHNSFSPTVATVAEPALVKRLGLLRGPSLKVGFVGNLHVSKGLYDLVVAAELVRRAGRDVEFVIIGGATRRDRGLMRRLLSWAGFAQDVDDDLPEELRRRNLTDCFHLLGPTTDIQRAYERMDVLCFPSHFDAPGRPVFEAAFSSVPSIVAVRDPKPDTLVPGQTGLAVPGGDPVKLAEAIVYLCDNRAEVARMGANARVLADQNFVPHSNAERLLALYQRLLTSRRTTQSTPR